MKKKFIIAALLAGVMAATCITGCNGNGNGEGEKGEQEQEQQGTFEKGVEVTAEEWTAAINASKDLTNFSICTLDSGTKTVTGNYKGNDKIFINLVNEFNEDYYEYIDLSNDNFLGFNCATKYLKSGYSDLCSHLDDATLDWWVSLEDCGIYFDEDYEENGTAVEYGVKINGKGYAVYGALGPVPSSLYQATYKDEEFEWNVMETEYVGLATSLGNVFSGKSATEENGEEKPLTELYGAFTYSDGIYTADLWGEGAMFTWSVSFKNGYVLSIAYQASNSHVEEKEGLTITNVGSTYVMFYNIGKTTVKPAPPEAMKAVEDYIKENS